jgi:hypothetical protein
MRVLLSVVALAAALSAADAASAQTRPSVGDLMSGIARGAGAAQRRGAEAQQAWGNRPDTAVQGGGGGQMDHTAPASDSSTKRAGFTPQPISSSLTSGGSIDAATLGGSCAGMVTSAPNYAFTYTAGMPLLFMRVRSQGDTTLVVRNPNGAWGCSDDYNGLNPALRWDSPQSGTYYIWVGAVGAPAQATLYITETE